MNYYGFMVSEVITINFPNKMNNFLNILGKHQQQKQKSEQEDIF